MILRRMKVAKVRCFSNPIELGPFGDGLNLIFAPNESGKSTMIEAVARALFDRHTVTGDKIESLRPWGSASLSPEIEIDFEVDGKAYRLKKGFLGNPFTTLYEFQAGLPVPKEEREHADDYVRQLMAGEASGRGASNARHWGIASALWCSQDLGTLSGLSVPDNICCQLLRALPGSTMPITSPITEIQALLTHKYADYYTDKGRQKKESLITKLDEKIEQLNSKVAEMKKAYNAAQQAAERLHDIERQAEAIQKEKTDLQASITAYEAEDKNVAALRARVEELRRCVEQQRKECDALVEDIKAYQQSAERHSQIEMDSKGLSTQLDDATTDRKATDILRRKAKKIYDEAYKAKTAADQARQQGGQTNAIIALMDEIGRLQQQLEDVRKALEQHQQRAQEFESLLCPTEEEVKRAGELEGTIKKLQGQLEAIGLVAIIEFSSDIQLQVQSGDDGARTLVGESGKEEIVHAGNTLDVNLPGAFSIHVTSAAREIEEVQEELRQANDELQALLTRYSATDAADLMLKRLHWLELKKAGDERDEQRKQSLKPYKTLDHLSDAIGEKKQKLATSCNLLGIAVTETLALTPVDESSLYAAYNAALQHEETQKNLLDELQEQYEQGVNTEQILRDKQEELLRLSICEETTMRTILQRCHCADLLALQLSIDSSKQFLDAVQQEYDGANAGLPDAATDPERLLATAKASLLDIERQERDSVDQGARVSMVIEQAQTFGQYEKLAAEEEELSALKIAYKRENRKAQAHKLLKELLDQRRNDAVTGQLPGLEDAISRMLMAITKRTRAITMTSSFAVDTVNEKDIDPYKPDALSGGTREQLDLVVRIALGEAYADEYGRTMMVLDDALLYTDPARHDRIKEILKIAAKKLQIFILTSHPDRYRGITSPEHQFDLLQIKTAHDSSLVGA